MNRIKRFLFPHSSSIPQDLSARDAYGNVLGIAIPAVAELLLVSLISSVDTMMVGSLGKQALSSVGLTSQPRLLVLCFFTALNVGISAVTARRKGEDRREDAVSALKMAVLLSVALSVLLMTASILLNVPLLRLAGGADDSAEGLQVLQQAAQYFRIMMLALPLNAVSLVICAAQRGAGNARITFQVNVLSNLVNVVFNYLLIEGRFGFPRLEVRGAAIASVIGIFAGFVLAVQTVVSKRRQKSFHHSKISRRTR